MSVVTNLAEELEIRLKRNKLTKAWLIEQMRKKGADISFWKFYNFTTPGRMEESRAEGYLKMCHDIIDNYEKQMNV